MALQDYQQFKGVTDWFEDSYSDNLKYGLIEWMRWSFLQIGAFQNVTAGQASGLYGGHPAILRPVSDPNFSDGRVWESIRSDWVWETGISYSTEPKKCSGVYVGGTFYDTDTTTGTYEHYIDYPRGRVVFNTPISTSSNVKSDYAFRTVSVDLAKKPYMQEMLYGSLNVERSDFNIAASGSHNQIAQTRRQLPTIGVELGNRSYSPYQLGGGQYSYQDIILYVLAENMSDRDKLVNILSNQNDKAIWLTDRKTLKDSGLYPYDIDVYGKKVSSPIQYPQLSSNSSYQWSLVQIRNTTTQHLQTFNNWLYRGAVRFTCAAIFQNI